MKPQRVTAIVVHEDIPEYGEPGEAQLLLPSSEIRYIQIDHPLGPGAAVELFQTPIPRNRDELIEHTAQRHEDHARVLHHDSGCGCSGCIAKN
jgi:hypothetical protein